MEDEPLIFDVNIAKDKPNSYRETAGGSECPFCRVDDLNAIYRRQGGMIWLRNKFPTLRETVQTVLIESSKHDGDIVNYSPEYNRTLMRFALGCFNKMNDSQQFRSVVWYKNFGPHSGGSLTHPHMQIVGLKTQDGYRNIHRANFEGISLFEERGVEVNVATHPVQGYVEVNVNLLAAAGIDLWADWIQSGARYMLNVLAGGRCDSYNLFFYPLPDDGVCAKLIARFTASPYFVGYKLSQVDNKEKLVQEAARLRKFFDNDARRD
ncbi:DUF4931 domain-containing protein [Lactobacillus sp. XV13L]|nr:DUF4931 domain-containing protein [Lactobacillus sp. XV13L]